MNDLEKDELKTIVKETLVAMAGNKKISELDPVITPLGTDEYAVNQGGVTLKETNAQISDYVKSSILPSDPNKVVITDALGEVTTDINLSYDSVSGALNTYVINTESINASVGSNIFNRQNLVSADRLVVASDIGVLLSKNPTFPGKLNLPPVGDSSFSHEASFWIWQIDPLEPLTVQAPAGVEIDGVDGGSITTEGYRSIKKITRTRLSRGVFG